MLIRAHDTVWRIDYWLTKPGCWHCWHHDIDCICLAQVMQFTVKQRPVCTNDNMTDVYLAYLPWWCCNTNQYKRIFNLKRKPTSDWLIYLITCLVPCFSDIISNRTQTVNHPSTNLAQCCLTSVIRWKLVKLHHIGIFNHLYQIDRYHHQFNIDRTF